MSIGKTFKTGIGIAAILSVLGFTACTKSANSNPFDPMGGTTINTNSPSTNHSPSYSTNNTVFNYTLGAVETSTPVTIGTFTTNLPAGQYNIVKQTSTTQFTRCNAKILAQGTKDVFNIYQDFVNSSYNSDPAQYVSDAANATAVLQRAIPSLSGLDKVIAQSIVNNSDANIGVNKMRFLGVGNNNVYFRALNGRVYPLDLTQAGVDSIKQSEDPQYPHP